MKTSRYVNLVRGLKCSALSLTAAAIALTAALPGTARAASFVPPGNATTTVASGDVYTIGTGENFWIGRWDSKAAILNQTGGSITYNGTWGRLAIGEDPGGWGVYNMSGNAVFSATTLTGSWNGDTYTIRNRNAGSKMTMIDDAVANIGSLTFGSYGGGGHIELSGNARLTVGVMGNNTDGYGFGSGYITFASGSAATLTITGKVLADYTSYVAAGSIRIDGATASIGQFQVSGNTLSLKPPFPGLDHFDISAIANPQQAGTAITGITITAKDSVDATLTTFTGAGNTVDFSGTAGITGTSGTFTDGVLSGVSVTPVTVGSGKTLVVVGGGRTGTSNTFDVNADPTVLDHFAITGITSPATAGTPISITVTAKNAYSNKLDSFTGTVVYSGTAGITGTSASFTSGELVGASVTPVTAGSGKTLIVTGSGKTGTNTFSVLPGAASKLAFTVQPPSSTFAGYAISPAVKVTVQDANGNTVTNDTRSVTISSSTTAFDGTSTLAVNAVAGLVTFSNLKPTTLGSGHTLTANDGSLTEATSSAFTVAQPSDTVTDWTLGTTMWTSTSGTYANGSRTVTAWIYLGSNVTGGSNILTQTGGTVMMTNPSDARLYISYQCHNSDCQYIMSGNAQFSGKAAIFNNNTANGLATWSLTGNATATLTGDLDLNNYNNDGNYGRLFLSGAATFSAASISHPRANSYISFASGSTATLTVANKVLADYQSMVTSGYIRVDGTTQTDFNKFQVTGHTLSLKPVPPRGTLVRFF